MEELLHKAYDALKEGEIDSAESFLRMALEIDFEHQGVLYTLKCLNWWLEKIKLLENYRDAYEKGLFILSQWKSYYGFLDRIGEIQLVDKETCDSCQYALRRFVFSKALDYFMVPMSSEVNAKDPALLLQVGRCCKGAGDWQEAMKYLEQARHIKKEDSGILSELADVYALLGEDRGAKTFFREAFFLDPQGIDIQGLESEMIQLLIKRVKELGYTGTLLAEWVPIWGNIWRVFHFVRELKPVELGRLKQSILSLENEYRNNKGGPEIKPRLLNRYFWLVDHCEHNRDSSSLINETLLKIKFLDPVVHEHYRT